MQTLRFKTSLKCNGCVDAITQGMNSIKGIERWRVFLDVQEKTLEIDHENANEEEIIKEIHSVFLKAEHKVEQI